MVANSDTDAAGDNCTTIGVGSSVILAFSLGAHAAVGTLSAYAATKGTIDTLVKYFAAALGPHGIRVNAGTSSRPTRASRSFSACRRSSGSVSLMMSARLWRSSPRKTRVGYDPGG